MRGLSAMAAALLILLVAAVAGFIVYSTVMTSTRGVITSTEAYAAGQLRVESYAVENRTLILYVRNIGESPASVDVVYLVRDSSVVAALRPEGGTVRIEPGEVTSVRVVLPENLESGEYTVRLGAAKAIVASARLYITVGATAPQVVRSESRGPWLEGWRYRRPITIINSLEYTLSGYQVRIVLTSDVFNFSRAKSDGSDIRFTLNDSSTLLPYWIEEWNPEEGRAVIWVKVPEIPANGNITIYMYYGNPDADFDPDLHGLVHVMEPLPASDGPGYQVYYQEWVPEWHQMVSASWTYLVGGDDRARRVSLPFSFPYYDRSISSFYACTNGFISTSYSTQFWDGAYYLRRRLMIAPLWEDLMGSVYYATVTDDTFGVSLRAFVLRWSGDFFWHHGRVEMQLMLYENGLIRVNYGTISSYSWDRPTIGVSLGDNQHYTLSRYNDEPAYVVSGKTIVFWPRKKATEEPMVVIGEEESR